MQVQNIYKRNNTYYFRVAIHKNLKEFFKVNKFYVRSLNTTNIHIAKYLRNILYNKFMILKDEHKILLEEQDIQAIVDDFKNIELKKYQKQVSYFNSEDFDEFMFHIKRAYKERKYKLVDNAISRFYDNYGIDSNVFDVENESSVQKKLMQVLIDSFDTIKSSNIENTTDSSQNNKQAQKYSLKELIEHYINTFKDKGYSKNHLNSIKNYLNVFLEHYENFYLKDFDLIEQTKFYNDVLSNLEYKKNGKNVKIGKSTLELYFSAYRGFFDYLLKMRIVDINIWIRFKPFSFQKGDKLIRKPFSDSQLFDILEFIQTKTRSKRKKQITTIILFSMYTGMRASEIIEIKTKDIHLEERYIDINDDYRTLKNKASIRFVPISDKLYEILKERISFRNTYAFEITSKKFGKDFSLFKQRMGFSEEYVFHSIRHTFINKLKQNDFALPKISELVGHSHRLDENVNENTASTYSQQYSTEILMKLVNSIEYKR